MNLSMNMLVDFLKIGSTRARTRSTGAGGPPRCPPRRPTGERRQTGGLAPSPPRAPPPDRAGGRQVGNRRSLTRPSKRSLRRCAQASKTSLDVLCWMLCQPSVGCSLWATPDLNIKETLLHTEHYRTPGTSILTKAILYTKNKFIAEIILKNGILKLEKLSGQVKEQHQRNHRVEFGCPSQSALWKSDVLRRPGLDKRWNVPICYSNPAIRIGHQRILL